MSGPAFNNNRYNNRVQPASGSGPVTGDALLAVANIAAMVALDDTTIDSGGVVSVRSMMDLWMLDKTSPLVPDGITVVAAPTAGNWVRLELPNLTWQLQANWYIDETVGDDENTGASSIVPLQTWAEYSRRVGEGPLTISHTVTLLSTLNQDLVVRTRMDDETNTITIVGVRSAPIYSGSFTGVTNQNAAANQELQLTDAALPVSWTASGLVDKLCVLTSGPNAGAAGWIAKDMGANTARATKFFNQGANTYVEPAVGETFEVVDLGLVVGALFGIEGGNVRCSLQDLRIAPSTGTAAQLHGGRWQLTWCDVEGSNMDLAARTQRSSLGDGTNIIATRLRASTFILINRGTVNLQAVYAASGFHMRAEAVLTVAQDSIVQYTGAGGGYGFNTIGAARINVVQPLGIFDYPTATHRAVRMLNSGVATIDDYLFGYGNAFDYALEMGPGSVMAYASGFKPLVAGAVVRDALIGGLARPYAALPATNLTKLAGIVVS
jgi:hypothetical protein